MARDVRAALVDSARRQWPTPVTLDGADLGAPGGIDVLALHGALVRLEARDVRLGAIAELHLFAGLSADEAADVLSISPQAASDGWMKARRWLQRMLGPIRQIAG